MTTPVTTPHHRDTGFYYLPSKEASSGGITHLALVPVQVVGSDRVRGPWTHNNMLATCCCWVVRSSA